MFKSKKVKSLLIVMTLSLSLSNFAYAATCKVAPSGNCQTGNLCNATQVLNTNSLCNGTSCTANNLCSLAKQCGVSVDVLKGMINNCSNGTCSNQMLNTLCANKVSSCPSTCSVKSSTCPKAKKAKCKVKAKTQAKQCINKTNCNK